mgnify:CR=1 FL=1
MGITDEQLEKIGELVDEASNCIAASQLRVRPEIHVEGLRGVLQRVEQALRELPATITLENEVERILISYVY